MTANKELLKTISDINTALTATIEDATKSESAEFYKESIKLAALQIFEKAQLLSAGKTPELKTHQMEVQPEIPVVIHEKVVVEEKKVVIIQNEPVVPEPVLPVAEVRQETKPVVEHIKPEPSKQKSVAEELKPAKEMELEEDKSLNAKIAKYQPPVINIADKLKETPIKELAKAISISKKFEFIKELFKGNADAYKDCLHSIEKLSSYQEAAEHIESNVAANYKWDENETLAAEFFVLVKRRFL